jgi:hypothetical protein
VFPIKESLSSAGSAATGVLSLPEHRPNQPLYDAHVEELDLRNRDTFQLFADTFRIPPWKLGLGLAAAIAAALALTVLATGLFLIVFPLVLVGFGLSRLFGGGRQDPSVPATQRAGKSRVIEVEYRVLDPDGEWRDRRG